MMNNELTDFIDSLNIDAQISLRTMPESDVKNDIIQTLREIPFMFNLLRGDRKRAKDLPRDVDEKITVNITEPHILEDMDYFRERALFYKTNGVYTHIVKNTHPQSSYMRFWTEELRRCVEGHIRYSDGEWIPGVYYWYLNYSPIQQARISTAPSKKEDDTVRVDGDFAIAGERVHDFPQVWDGDYLWFHYLDQARKAGKHASNLKSRGRGYEQPYYSKIKTLNGETTMGDVKVGDKIVTSGGDEATVIEKFEQGVKDVYEVTFSDGRKVHCGLNHLWAVYKNYQPSKPKPYQVLTLKDILDDGLYYDTSQKQRSYKYRLPTIHPVLYEENEELPVHPYVMGALLGDGSMSTPSIKIASSDPEILHNISRALGSDYVLNRDHTTTNNHLICYTPAKKAYRKNNPLKTALIDLGVNKSCKYKFIPDIYKRSSIESRIWLVKGLMDTDGSITEDGNLEFSNSNERLVDDFIDVLRSLGVVCKKNMTDRTSEKSSMINTPLGKREIKRGIEYRVFIRSNKNMFALSRKSERVKSEKLVFDKPFIKDIQLVGKHQSACVLIDSEEHIYLTDDFVPTHNSLKAAAIMSNNYYCYARSNSFVTASDAKYLYGGDGVLDKTWDTLNFIDNNTAWKKTRDYVDKNDRKRASYKDPRTKTEKGFKSQIIGISTNGDPEKVRGLRGRTILNEEAGKYPNLLTAYGIERPSVEQGNITFGQIITWGTGGSVGADFEGIKALFKQPKGYRIYALPNVFDKKAPKGDTCGFYHGEYLNREGCMDRNGNSDVIKALKEIFFMRENIRKETTDPNAIIQEKADRSITPDEAMMKREGSLFNIEDLKIRQSLIETDDRLLNSSWKVNLFPDNGTIKYKLNHDDRPVRDFPIRETKGVKGCVEIWEHPVDNAGRGLYIFGCDPYDDDVGTSLGSIFCMNRLTRRIVAEYTGRPNTADEFYEICLRLIRYYNGVCNYENNKKGMFQYFDKMNATYLLADTPQILRDLEITKMIGHGNTAKGTNTNKATNSYGNSVIKGYLVAPAYNREGEQNWNTIPSVGLLKELIAFNPEEGNYDRVSALKMLLIYEADLHRHDILDPDSPNIHAKPDIDRFFARHRSNMSKRFELAESSDNSRKLYRR